MVALRSTARSGLTRAEMVALALVVALLAAWGGLLLWRHGVASRSMALDAGAAAFGGSAAGAGKPNQAGEISRNGDGLAGLSPDEVDRVQAESGPVVHVAGAVRAPGVYELPPGSRVIDAVRAAGGFTAEAAADWLNLAAKIGDGEKVYVPGKKEIAPAQGRMALPGAALPGPGAGTLGGGFSGGPIGGKINLNSADQAALDSLPGIGPALAQRIIAYRVSHGPFQSIEELRNVSGIGEQKFAEIRGLVTAP